VTSGNIHTGLDAIAFGSLFTWAWQELFEGVNYFHRALGLVVLIGVIASRFSNNFWVFICYWAIWKWSPVPEKAVLDKKRSPVPTPSRKIRYSDLETIGRSDRTVSGSVVKLRVIRQMSDPGRIPWQKEPRDSYSRSIDDK
jgi:hypothetical protein